MGFLQHYDDISINKVRSGQPIKETFYGYNVDKYVKGELSPINFWSPFKLYSDMVGHKITLSNPLVVESEDYTIGDMFFETKCVGYAVEHGYDSVIIESHDNTHCITVDFVSSMLSLMEAPQANGRPIATSRPKKSPPKGMKVDVMLANTGKLSPDRVERAMKTIRKAPPKISGVKDINGAKYFRAEYNFKANTSTKNQIGYADISQDKTHCKELFCTCADFFYRLYAPYVAAGLSTWNIPSKYKSKQNMNVDNAPHNHKWTFKNNPMGKLFLCKHLWAFLAYYVSGNEGNVEMSDEEIQSVIDTYFGGVEDGDDEDSIPDTEFKKAFGKLYMDKTGKNVEYKEKPLSGVKIKKPKPIKKDTVVDDNIDNNDEEEMKGDEK